MRLWRIFFCVAAINNLVIGGIMLFNADQAAAQMGVSGSAASYIVGFGGLMIAIFGVAYALVAYRPIPNRGIVVVGALGKAATVVFSSWHAAAHHIPQNVYLVSMGDLVFAAIFCVFLAQTRRVPGGTP